MTATSESVNDNIKKIVAGVFCFFIIIGLYVNEFSWYANTFNRNQLILVGIVLGLLAGLAAGYKLQHKSQEIIGKFQICLGMMIVGAILMPLLFSLTNRILSIRGVVEESVEFVKSEAFNESRFGHIPQENPDGFYAFVLRRGTVERLTTKEQIYEEASKGSQVTLPVKKGLWGFEIAYPHLLHE